MDKNGKLQKRGTKELTKEELDIVAGGGHIFGYAVIIMQSTPIRSSPSEENDDNIIGTAQRMEEYPCDCISSPDGFETISYNGKAAYVKSSCAQMFIP